MEKELYKFLKENTDNSKKYGCFICRENLLTLARLIRGGKKFTFAINSEKFGNYIHIDKVSERI